MEKEKMLSLFRNSLPKHTTLVVFLVIAVLISVKLSHTQSNPIINLDNVKSLNDLKAFNDNIVVSPADGAIVHSGEIINLVIQAPPGKSLQKVSTEFLPFLGVQSTTSPFTLSLSIPSDFTGPLTFQIRAEATDGSVGGDVLTLNVEPPMARIIVRSPINGQRFSSGDTVMVVIEPGPSISFTKVLLTCPGALLDAASSPFEIPLSIPNDFTGQVKCLVLAITPSGERIGTEFTFRVEPPSSAVLNDLQVDPKIISLSFPGLDEKITVQGVFSDATLRDLTLSSNTSINSLNDKVAVVENIPQGKYVKAIGPGKTTIRVQNGLLKTYISVAVQIFDLKGDLDGDGDVDQGDLNILLKARNTPATGPGDPRDLNGDGTIDALDTSRLQSLCTRPRCATN